MVDNKTHFFNTMVSYKSKFDINEMNDYPFFLLIGAMLNFVDYGDGGVLTADCIKSLETDINPYILQIQKGNPKLSQNDLVKFCLNIINSYGVCLLFNDLYLSYLEDPVFFYDFYEFPDTIKKDFTKLSQRCSEVTPILKSIIDLYTPLLDGRYKTKFLKKKNKGFIKPTSLKHCLDFQ